MNRMEDITSLEDNSSELNEIEDTKFLEENSNELNEMEDAANLKEYSSAVNEMEDPTNMKNKVKDPEVGAIFDSLEELVEYYKNYGKEKGFEVTIRTSSKGDGGELKYLTLACSRSGKSKCNSRNSLKLHPITKTDCQARVRACICLDGKWKVCSFVLEHNHELSTPSKTRFFRSSRTIKPYMKRKIEVNDRAGIRPNKNYNSFVFEAGGYDKLPFLEKDCRNYIQKMRQLRLGEGDATAIQQYFMKMQSSDSNFFYIMDLDQDGRLKNVFWVDARSRAAYREFGDVVTFDTTYLTNKYDMPFAPFVGVNHHGHSTLLGCALISNEDTPTFTWLFQSWLTSMSGCAPNGIITYQDRAMQNAIEIVFPNTRHRWCLWHIMKNIPEKFKSYTQYEPIKSSFKSIVYDSLTCEEFEESWNRFTKTYNLQQNEWLDGLYNERRRWVPAFVKDSFWAGMSTTQRSESMHAFFDGYVNSKTTLKQFVEQYENALHNKVEKEKLADFACFNSRVPCKNRYEFEKQFQDAFTIDKFKEFMDEFAGKIYCGLSSVKENIALAEFLVYEDVKVWECSKRVIFKVILNEEANEVKCNCRLFEFRGILCRHIILVLIEKQIFRISEKYIFRRWRKDVKRCHTKVKVSYADWSSKPEAHRFEKMCNLFYEVADMATKSDEKCNMVMGLVNDLKLKLTSNEVVSESNQHETNVIDGATQVDKFEDTSNGGCKILSPRVVRGKGRPPSKRLQSKVEKVIQKRKAKNIQMKSNEKKLEKDFGRTKGLGNAFDTSFDTYMHIEKFPEGIRKYITHQTEVLPDGNCGYRTIAMAMRFGHNEWRRVRKDLLQQLQDMSSIFKKCIREHKRYYEIERALNYFDDGFAPFFSWMTMPDMGHIIATCYNVVLILLSMRQCLTFLPFSVQSSETKLREIAIGFVDDDHYVQVHLSPDHPIPPVSRMWHEQSDICNVTHLYSRYQARVDAFQQLPGVENVATTDMVILMTDENAPTTELRL